MKADIKSLNMTELKTELLKMGEKPFRAGQIFSWLHERRATDFCQMTDLSLDLRKRLDERFYITVIYPVRELISGIDGTRKYLFRLSDGNVIESVWMEYHHGNSVCISSQAGCRMGCAFCASSINGMARSLTASEMLDEVYRMREITGKEISNIVVMGSGEPLDNYDNLVRFIRLITDERGMNISVRNITVSTCGIPAKIRSLAREDLKVTLALSLHAPDDEKRKKLMPIANRYSLSEVLSACDFYFEKTGRRVSYEYSLIDGVNDAAKDAEELSALLKGKNCHVNLIPLNPVKERKFVSPGRGTISVFKNMLEKNGINVTIRREMGRDINGACGQLRLGYKEDDHEGLRDD